MASMAELVKLQDQINALGVLIQQVESRMEVIEERQRGGSVDASAPVADSGNADEIEDLKARLLKLEVAAAKGKPGRKPKAVQKALEAEEAA